MLVYWEIRSTNHTIQLLKKRDLIAWEMKHTKKVVIGVFLTLILTISSQSSTIPQYLDLPQNQQYITAANNASAEPEKGSVWANEVGMHFLCPLYASDAADDLTRVFLRRTTITRQNN